jgi:type IV fimbrial biogenesis protein FimT
VNRQTGITLIELMLALAVLAIISIATIPGLSTLIYNIRMSSSVNELIHSLHSARQNARVTGIATAVCSSSDGKQCQTDNQWEKGWLIFSNSDADEPPQVDPDELILGVRGPVRNMHISANRRAFIMRPFGLRSTNGTLIWCDKRGSDHARAVVVSFTGKPRINSAAADDRPVNCPDDY